MGKESVKRQMVAGKGWWKIVAEVFAVKEANANSTLYGCQPNRDGHEKKKAAYPARANIVEYSGTEMSKEREKRNPSMGNKVVSRLAGYLATWLPGWGCRN